jgi:hypothetical protein
VIASPLLSSANTELISTLPPDEERASKSVGGGGSGGGGGGGGGPTGGADGADVLYEEEAGFLPTKFFGFVP